MEQSTSLNQTLLHTLSDSDTIPEEYYDRITLLCHELIQLSINKRVRFICPTATWPKIICPTINYRKRMIRNNVCYCRANDCRASERLPK